MQGWLKSEHGAEPPAPHFNHWFSVNFCSTSFRSRRSFFRAASPKLEGTLLSSRPPSILAVSDTGVVQDVRATHWRDVNGATTTGGGAQNVTSFNREKKTVPTTTTTTTQVGLGRQIVGGGVALTSSTYDQ